LENGADIDKRLVESQKKTLQAMTRSHRLLMAYIYYENAVIYLWMGWVILFILWMGVPPTVGAIALLVIVLPVIMTPFLYKRFRLRYGYLLEARERLADMMRAESPDQFSRGISSYIALLLHIVKPTEEQDDNVLQGRTRAKLRDLRTQSWASLGFMLVLMYLVLTNFLIPEIIELLETGGVVAVLLNPVIMVLGALVAITISGIILYLLWEFQVRRWLRICNGLISWGEEIERMTSLHSSDDEGGRLA
jgi:hypothetical protein